MNTDTIKGNGNVTRGKLKQRYAQLTDSDLTYSEGQEDEQLGRLQKKTGQTREELEKFLHDECRWDFSVSDRKKINKTPDFA